MEKKNKLTHCRVDNTSLVIRRVKRNPQQLTKPYYYSAYYFCPTCRRMYFADEFKIVNKNGSQLDFEPNRPHPPTKSGSLPREGKAESFDVEIWTDGACSSNGTHGAKAAWAFVSGEYEERDVVEGKQTNNIAEAQAILHALMWAASKGYTTIRIHTDSQITIHGVTKPVEMVKENREIFRQIRDVIEQNKLFVHYEKVLGHSGNPNNERADKLAASLVGKV